MGFPRSLTQIYRRQMLFVGAGWRALFAPFDAVAQQNNPFVGGPDIVDLSKLGPFSASAPPAGFYDCGWVRDFKVSPQSKIGQVRSGYRGAIRNQYRGQVGSQFNFTFREHGRLQYQLATGVQVYNVLSTSGAASTTSPLAGTGVTAVAIGASGYVASGAVAGYAGYAALYVPTGSGALFPAGTYIVADIDYVPGAGGLQGENGAFAYPNSVTDVDWIRKTSSFTARVVAVVTGAQDALVLDQPFYGGGSPASSNGVLPATAKVQKILGWSAREGGTFIQEWSGILFSDSVDGAQIAIYYPHISPMQFTGLNSWTLENAGTTDLAGLELQAQFEALAFDDPEDGETVVNFTTYYPGTARTQSLY